MPGVNTAGVSGIVKNTVLNHCWSYVNLRQQIPGIPPVFVLKKTLTEVAGPVPYSILLNVQLNNRPTGCSYYKIISNLIIICIKSASKSCEVKLDPCSSSLIIKYITLSGTIFLFEKGAFPGKTETEEQKKY